MKKIYLIFALTFHFLHASSIAQIATREEAQIVAKNWIQSIINKKGDWGGFENGKVERILDFTAEGKTIGYFCNVKPTGFIILSLRKELAPVKAYSARYNMMPNEDDGLAIIIKAHMERSLKWIEKQFGSIDTANTADVENAVEISYKKSWTELLAGAINRADPAMKKTKSGNYSEGDSLLTSQWHQSPPFNDQCPDMNCDWLMYGNFNQNALVGCTAVAGAQMMRYWNWPPKEFFNYNWAHMLDKYMYDGAGGFHNGSYSPCSNTQINAVAYLCGNVAKRIEMDYGCEQSSAYVYSSIFTSLFDVLRGSLHYYCSYESRDDYNSGAEWFDYMKDQFNQNRPLIYQIMTSEDERHVVVADGWQEIGAAPIRQYHLNYGWGGSSNGWYTVDAIPNSEPGEEFVLGYLHPLPTVDKQILGDYFKLRMPYRYFDQDATGENATFYSGQKLQFLPGITVKCVGSYDACIQFSGRNTTDELNTYLFTRGNITNGIKLIDADLKLFNGGSVRFH